MDRLPVEELGRLKSFFQQCAVPLDCPKTLDHRVQHLRTMYEPYAYALAERLIFTLPRWSSESTIIDNWKTTAWEHAGRPLVPGDRPSSAVQDDHL